MIFRLLIIVILLSINLVLAQDSTKVIELERRLKALEEKFEQSELEKIMKEAESIATEKAEKKETKVFKSGQRSLQALNPEISVASDAFGQFILNKDFFDEENRSGAHFRVAEVQIQSPLDPFSTTKVILEFKPGDVEFAEAYLTWNRILPNISLTAGKFRQQFGVVNRWHAHALDQFDFPLALTTILGKEGLNQMGISLDWLLPPLFKSVNYLTLQLTNGQNEHLFAGEMFSFPVVLVHFKNYRDLNRDTYLEVGFTGMEGTNNLRGYIAGEKIKEPVRWTRLAGLDLSFLWEPVARARYQYFLWRSELYYVNKELPGTNKITTWGGYSYLEYKFARRWHVGMRFDYTQPFKISNSGKYLYQIVPYVTWWQSPWVKLRLQYNFLNGNVIDQAKNTLRLQITWAIGPHKHERY